MAASIKRELNRYLKELNKADLEKEVKKLYSKFKEVKQFYEMELGQDTNAVLDEYKALIKKEYLPKRGYPRASSRESKKVITAFKKIAIFKKDIVDLMLYRVEVMIIFSNEFGYLDEPFVLSIERTFEDACKLIQVEKLVSFFKQRCLDILSETWSIGYGLHDGLKYSYDEYLN